MKADSKITSAGGAAADADSTAQSEPRPTENPTVDLSAPGLTVCIRPHGLGFWEYAGTRSDLEAEGIVPPDFAWPERTEERHWQAGSFKYGLRRSRPEGLKGPMALWTRGDWWTLRCTLIDGPDNVALIIMDKKRELLATMYRYSPAGQRELAQDWKARADAAFQAFKAKIPCLTPQKRGGKPKIASEGGAA